MTKRMRKLTTALLVIALFIIMLWTVVLTMGPPVKAADADPWIRWRVMDDSELPAGRPASCPSPNRPCEVVCFYVPEMADSPAEPYPGPNPGPGPIRTIGALSCMPWYPAK